LGYWCEGLAFLSMGLNSIC